MTCNDCEAGPLDFGHVAKHPLEQLTILFDFTTQIAHYWQENESVQAGSIRRPSIADGFVYQAQTTGTTAAREPRWSRSAGTLTQDGSVSWEAISASPDNAIDPVVSVSASCDLDLSIIGTPDFTSYSGKVVVGTGTAGGDYQVLCSVTTQSGAVLVGVALVQVRDRLPC